MKLFFAVFMTLAISIGYAQSTNGSGGYNSFEGPKKGDLQGTMYANEKFSALKVNGEAHKSEVRYNAFEDKMEFIDNLFYAFQVGDELSLTDDHKKYIFADYKDDKDKFTTGYLILAQSGKKVKLYKKEKIRFVKGNVSQTGFDKTVPDKYVKDDDTFFLQINDGDIISIPNSKKDFSKLFGEKEKEVMDFVKKNNSSLKTENDLKILMNYLNTIL